MINKYIENIAPMTHMQIHKILDVPFEKMKQVPAFLCHLENGLLIIAFFLILTLRLTSY